MSALPTSASEIAYVGGELELFAQATTWKAYFSRRLAPFISGRVAEVGAGIGSNTTHLWNPKVTSWLCLEPDAAMARALGEKRALNELPPSCDVMQGVLTDLPEAPAFDTIVYIDVLEHIENDGAELAAAARRLAPGGRVVVLSPAHQFLFTPFDAAIGHFRRYSAGALGALTPPGLALKQAFYLDSVGATASLANRVLLKTAHPKLSQIRFWDRVLVPCSKVVDRLTFGRLGKTVVAVWQR